MCLFVLIYIIIIIINYAYTCNYFKRVVLINFNAHNDLHTILTVPFLHTHIFFHNCSSRHHYHRTTHYHCIPRPYTLSLHTSYITPTPLLHHSYTTPTPHSYTAPTHRWPPIYRNWPASPPTTGECLCAASTGSATVLVTLTPALQCNLAGQSMPRYGRQFL